MSGDGQWDRENERRLVRVEERYDALRREVDALRVDAGGDLQAAAREFRRDLDALWRRLSEIAAGQEQREAQTHHDRNALRLVLYAGAFTLIAALVSAAVVILTTGPK